jgi:hypothetical protein
MNHMYNIYAIAFYTFMIIYIFCSEYMLCFL